MLDVAVSIVGLHELFGGDFKSVVEAVRGAESAGVDQMSLGEHLVMGKDVSKYPYGDFSFPLDYPWLEPVTMLSAVASATSRIRLSTDILIGPLRPAVLLAKQLATLDHISRGRLELGVGPGWHRAEYDAVGVPFETRGALMDEQILACKVLWSQSPASFKGHHVHFDEIYASPKPFRASGIPITFGVPASRRNRVRIAELGDGWLPLWISPAAVQKFLAELRSDFLTMGRDPDKITVRVTLLPEATPKNFADLTQRTVAQGQKALDETLAPAQGWLDAGVTCLEIYPSMFCRKPEDLDMVFKRLVGLKDLRRTV
jgi:probable F420-dependent oxidoreductase